MSPARSLLLPLLVLSLGGCAEASPNAPLRSPSQDYGPPPPTTSDGRVVGVDNKSPGDHIAENASSRGAAPGWNFQKNRPLYDPRRRVGGAVDIKEPSEASAARRLAPTSP